MGGGGVFGVRRKRGFNTEDTEDTEEEHRVH